MTARVSDTTGMRRAFEVQADHCAKMGAPFNARLCRVLSDILDDTSALGRRVISWPRENQVGDLVPLRCCAGFHALARSGQIASLRAIYPPATCDDGALRAAISATITAQDAFLAAYLDSPPQTNEVGRSAILLGGVLAIAHETSLPIALNEIGASAGLNMSFARWHYDLGKAGSWGPADAPVAIQCPWTGAAPPLDAQLSIISRAASDLAPLDPGKASDRERLMSYIWPDQAERLVRTAAALDVASADTLRVAQADARAWLRETVTPQSARDRTCTVLFHSVFIQYLDPPVRAALIDDIRARGLAASERAPFAWLRMEAKDADKARCELRLTVWPDGHDRHLADVDWHGRSADWMPR